ncbi:methyltransferase domain-containing protein [Gilvimarinus agarilyticus]|uniref:methyltransferase domain-containing protein n=1 Tax=Gilvimarinus agarilyticus TaxID=679259 RepID=UPI0006989EB0|nr:methyltransferase domain-containing protein [Gilvimarinus agarilyticus]
MLEQLKAKIKRRRDVRPAAEAVPALTDWFNTPAGQGLLACEKADIDQALACLFGYHLCQLSVARGLKLTDNSRIAHAFALNPCATSGGLEAGCCDFGRLPLAPESVDVFVLHHALDFSQTPHQLLAEVAKATIARGYIVIVGFNPWSLGGLLRLLRGWFGHAPEGGHQALRWGRLQDWCKLLDLVPVNITRGQFWPRSRDNQRPLESWLRRVGAPWGNYYAVTVRKDVPAVLPLKPRWNNVELRGFSAASVPSKVGRGSSRTKNINK